MAMFTRNPIVDSVIADDGVLYVLSTVEVPEVRPMGEAMWIKLRTPLDPAAPLRLAETESLRSSLTPAQRLFAIHQRIVQAHHEAIERAIVQAEQAVEQC